MEEKKTLKTEELKDVSGGFVVYDPNDIAKDSHAMQKNPNIPVSVPDAPWYKQFSKFFARLDLSKILKFQKTTSKGGNGGR